MSSLTKKLGKHFHQQKPHKNKIPRNKFNRGSERLLQQKSQITEERNQRRHQKLKDFPYSWIGRINFIKNSYITKSNQYAQFNPHQNSNDRRCGSSVKSLLCKCKALSSNPSPTKKISMTFITEIEKINTKVHMKTQKSANSQGNTEQKQQCWRYHNS
jgi:hypothetical protein